MQDAGWQRHANDLSAQSGAQQDHAPQELSKAMQQRALRIQRAQVRRQQMAPSGLSLADGSDYHEQPATPVGVPTTRENARGKMVIPRDQFNPFDQEGSGPERSPGGRKRMPMNPAAASSPWAMSGDVKSRAPPPPASPAPWGDDKSRPPPGVPQGKRTGAANVSTGMSGLMQDPQAGGSVRVGPSPEKYRSNTSSQASAVLAYGSKENAMVNESITPRGGRKHTGAAQVMRKQDCRDRKPQW